MPLPGGTVAALFVVVLYRLLKVSIFLESDGRKLNLKSWIFSLTLGIFRLKDIPL